MAHKSNIIAIMILACLFLAAGPAKAVRIKDMASVRGVRANQLIGYGLVVGLNGTGDKSSTTFTNQGLANMLNRMGLKVSASGIKVKNVAAVMITTKLPPYARLGNRLDVTLSSLGDATSLAGGTLIMTPAESPGRQCLRRGPGAHLGGRFLRRRRGGHGVQEPPNRGAHPPGSGGRARASPEIPRFEGPDHKPEHAGLHHREPRGQTP